MTGEGVSDFDLRNVDRFFRTTCRSTSLNARIPQSFQDLFSRLESRSAIDPFEEGCLDVESSESCPIRTQSLDPIHESVEFHLRSESEAHRPVTLRAVNDEVRKHYLERFVAETEIVKGIREGCVDEGGAVQSSDQRLVHHRKSVVGGIAGR